MRRATIPCMQTAQLQPHGVGRAWHMCYSLCSRCLACCTVWWHDVHAHASALGGASPCKVWLRRGRSCLLSPLLCMRVPTHTMQGSHCRFQKHGHARAPRTARHLDPAVEHEFRVRGRARCDWGCGWRPVEQGHTRRCTRTTPPPHARVHPRSWLAVSSGGGMGCGAETCGAMARPLQPISPPQAMRCEAPRACPGGDALPPLAGWSACAMRALHGPAAPGPSNPAACARGMLHAAAYSHCHALPAVAGLWCLQDGGA